jgi:hypothetical protein
MSVVRVARPRAVILFLAGAMLFASMVLERPAEAAGSASISGVVTNGEGQPLDGVTVSVDRAGTGGSSEWSTDSDGRFVASELSAGTYAVCFYVGKALLECWEDIEPSIFRYTPIEVADGEQVTGIDAVLEPSHLSGRVTNKRDEPVAGVRVSATWYAADMILCCQSSITAEDGSFDIGPLYSGEYTLQFSDSRSKRYASEWWDDAPTAAAALRIQVAREESVNDLDAVLDDLPHIAGQVRGAGGASARGAVVRALRYNGPEFFYEVDSSPVAADGSYDVGGLQPGTYRLEFDAAPGKYRSEWWRNVRSIGSAHDVVISGTTSVTGIDAVLSLAPPVRATRAPVITGRTRVGERLRVTDGAWDVGPLRLSYQWRADGEAIPGATGQRLWLGPGLRGKRISVRVKATAIDHERSPGRVVARRTEPVARR